MQIVVKNLLIDFFERKKDNGMALLFLHGWRSQKEVWQNFIDKLPAEAGSVYALDFPGFGKSPPPAKAMTVGDYAYVVRGFIEKLQLNNVIVVGHSFGGRVGVKLASDNPKNISKLVLVDSAGFSMDSNKKTAMNAAAKIAKPFFKPKFMELLRKKIYEKIGSEDYLATPGIMTEIYLNAISEDLSGDLKNITAPTLIVWGEKDTTTPVSFAERTHKLIANSQIKILSGAGHFSFLDKPEEFLESLIGFLQHEPI